MLFDLLFFAFAGLVIFAVYRAFFGKGAISAKLKVDEDQDEGEDKIVKHKSRGIE